MVVQIRQILEREFPTRSRLSPYTVEEIHNDDNLMISDFDGREMAPSKLNP